MSDKRFYWLKLKRDFFKRHDIRIIEVMPNGKDYILFYLKLLCESVDHNGNLRFSEQIPYNEDMLATITNTNVDIVRSAIKVFSSLNMMEIMDDGTYYMSEVEKMIGSAVDNDNANRQRRFRERQKAEKKLLTVTENNASVTESNADVTQSVTEDNESKSIEKDIDKEKDIENIYNNTYVQKSSDLNSIEEDFARFWSAYPKKQGKKDAFKAFKKASLKVDVDIMINALTMCKVSSQWKKENGKYIPMASTWLNGERWNDEFEVSNMDTYSGKVDPLDRYKEMDTWREL